MKPRHFSHADPSHFQSFTQRKDVFALPTVLTVCPAPRLAYRMT